MITPMNHRLEVGTSTISRSSAYPENLSKIADSDDERSSSFGQYNHHQILAASEKLNQREQAAFGYLSHDASTSGIIQFAKAYISYINSLSPEEQNGVRYRGTKESVSNLLAQAQTQLQNEKEKPVGASTEFKSLLSRILDEMQNQFQQRGINQKSHFSNAKTTDFVTISEAGHRRLSNQI